MAWFIGFLLIPVAIYVSLIVVAATTYLRRSFIYWFRYRHFQPTRIGPIAFLSVLACEAWAAYWVLIWCLVRRGEWDKSTPANVPIVILVPGLGADGTSMFAFRQPLQKNGFRAISAHIGWLGRPIERYAERLHQVVEKAIQANPDAPFDFVAHSLGGVVIGEWLRQHPELAGRVRTIIAIGSPLRGTPMARFIPFPETQQIVPGNPWIEAMPSLSVLAPVSRIITMASNIDAVVFPVETSLIAGTTHFEMNGRGHVQLLMDRHVIARVVESLANLTPTAPVLPG